MISHRSGRLAFVAVGCLLLGACGGRDTTPAFAPADYSYLPKLRLMVGTLTVEDHASQPAGSDDLAPNAPLPPDQALQQMARDRLVAAGNSGTGVFTIDQASITGSGAGALDGHLAVHLDILTGNGGHAGYAEAHVTRQFVPGADTSDAGTRAELYDLTRQMMQDMNVELEYQVRRSLRDWLVDASGAPASGVDQQTLPPPGAGPPVTGESVTGAPGGLQVGTTPMGATPLSASPAGSGLGPPPDAGTGPPAPPPGVPDHAPTVLTPNPAAVPRSPPPGFLRPPEAPQLDTAPLPPPAADRN